MKLPAFFRFIFKGFTQWEQTASFLPSQRFLIGQMCDSAKVADAHYVIEIGPGAGVITQEILRRLPADGRLVTVEIDPHLHEAVVHNCPDARLTAILGSAADLPKLLQERGLPAQADAVISSLGMSMLPDALCDEILEACKASLKPGARFVQFGYRHTRYMAYAKGKGVYPFDYLSVLRKHFGVVAQTVVNLNAPPAWVYAATQPTLPRAQAQATTGATGSSPSNASGEPTDTRQSKGSTESTEARRHTSPPLVQAVRS